MICKKLKWNDREDRHHTIGCVRQGDNFVSDFFKVLCAVTTGEGNNRALTRFNLLDVIHVFREDSIVGSDENRGKIRSHQSDNAVLEFGARMALGKEIGDLFHF